MCFRGSKFFLYLDVYFFPQIWENFFNNFTKYVFYILVFFNNKKENYKNNV